MVLLPLLSLPGIPGLLGNVHGTYPVHGLDWMDLVCANRLRLAHLVACAVVRPSSIQVLIQYDCPGGRARSES